MGTLWPDLRSQIFVCHVVKTALYHFYLCRNLTNRVNCDKAKSSIHKDGVSYLVATIKESICKTGLRKMFRTTNIHLICILDTCIVIEDC